MNTLFLGLSAAAGLVSAAGHSFLSERFIMAPLFATPGENRALKGAATRRVIRWVNHLPSLAWAQVALATLWLAFASPPWAGAAFPAFAVFGAAIYLSAAAANAYALRRAHPGNVLLTVAGATLLAGGL